MNVRIRHSLQAATISALVAALATAGIGFATGKPDLIYSFSVYAALSSMIVTFQLWYFMFGRRHGGIYRAALAGILVVIFSMILMWAAIGLVVTGDPKHLLTSIIVSLFGLATFGTILLPAGAVCAMLVRWFQITRDQSVSGLEKPRPFVTASAKRVNWSKILGRVVMAVIAVLFVGVLGFFYLFYSVFKTDTIRFKSVSPTGQKTFQTDESCFLLACNHSGKVTLNSDQSSRYSEPCNLRLTGEVLLFGKNTKMEWKEDETIVTWTLATGDTGKIDLRKDCAHTLPIHSPSLNHSLFIKESCLLGTCRRWAHMSTPVTGQPGQIKWFTCQFSPEHPDQLITNTTSKLTFKWSINKETVSWKTKSPELSGAINIKADCKPSPF